MTAVIRYIPRDMSSLVCDMLNNSEKHKFNDFCEDAYKYDLYEFIQHIEYTKNNMSSINKNISKYKNLLSLRIYDANLLRDFFLHCPYSIIKNIKKLNLQFSSFMNDHLEYIEFFPNLEDLNLQKNYLEEDVYIVNSKILKLNISMNDITTLHLKHNIPNVISDLMAENFTIVRPITKMK